MKYHANKHCFYLGSLRTTLQAHTHSRSPQQQGNSLLEWEKIATGTMSYTGNVNVIRFQYEQQLYQLLAKDTTWCDSSAVLDSFYIANSNSEYAHLYQTQMAIVQGDWTLMQNLLNTYTYLNPVSIAQSQYFGLLGKSRTHSITSSDSLLLTDLAQLCGSEMGWVVAASQSLYNAYYIQNIAFTEYCNTQANTRLNADMHQDTDLNILPNPTNGEFSVQLKGNQSESYQLSIQNMEGKTLIGKPIELIQGQATLQTNLAKGIYILNLSNLETHENYTEKLIIY